ncbi:hypothetical protein H8N03_14045 [Ramlibacter sp. USB13]|uniref:DUF4124 domain-containing protein n=1 Tax=Ramlibacter cellulosilyticus TaxID=2764187 RepID=A0A923MTV0_9BURK|nr:hypothetical protein [Ramlibacter cellulosilyticus]MBC5784069.1 hypothetical protein [Ramlibacter cellulosilyticus]
MNAKAWVAAAAFLATGLAHATCYTVYKADGTVLQEGSTSPVNMALPIGDTIPEKFGPGSTMTVSDLGIYCKDSRRGVVVESPAIKAAKEQAKVEKVGEKVAVKEDAGESAR